MQMEVVFKHAKLSRLKQPDNKEEMEQRKDTVEDLSMALKELYLLNSRKGWSRLSRTLIKMAEKGKLYMDHVRARLEFISADSESGS